MQTRHLVRTAAAIASIAFALTACNRQKYSAPETETTTGMQPRAAQTTVVGCVQRGPADSTFVLNAAQTKGGSDTATYALTAPADLKLDEHVGEMMEVTGTIRAEQEIASSGSVQEKPAKGTSGTPVVQTTEQIDVRRLDVQSAKPTGDRCTTKATRP